MSKSFLSFSLASAALVLSVLSHAGPIIQFKSIREELESGITKLYSDGHVETDIRQTSLAGFGSY